MNAPKICKSCPKIWPDLVVIAVGLVALSWICSIAAEIIHFEMYGFFPY